MHPPLQVTYVVGSSHSGSTLLALLADENPAIASVGETSVKRRIRREGNAASQRCSCGESLGQCGFWRRVFAEVSQAGVRFDEGHWSNDYRFEHPWADALLSRETSLAVLRRARTWASSNLPLYRARTALIDRTNVAFVRAVLSQSGATVFFDTSKLLTRLTHLMAIPELDVRVVQLVRDVRGFAASAKRRGESSLKAARVWYNDQHAIQEMMRGLPGERKMMIRYEDLCADPGAALGRLWVFCGVEPIAPPTSVRSSDHHILGNSMRLGGTIEIRLDDDWKTRLDQGEVRAVLSAAGSTNQRFGYA